MAHKKEEIGCTLCGRYVGARGMVSHRNSARCGTTQRANYQLQAQRVRVNKAVADRILLQYGRGHIVESLTGYRRAPRKEETREFIEFWAPKNLADRCRYAPSTLKKRESEARRAERAERYLPINNMLCVLVQLGAYASWVFRSVADNKGDLTTLKNESAAVLSASTRVQICIDGPRAPYEIDVDFRRIHLSAHPCEISGSAYDRLTPDMLVMIDKIIENPEIVRGFQ